MTIRLYLVRHGETPMNAARQLQGITDAALTAKGRAAADRLGELLRPVPFAKSLPVIAAGQLKPLIGLLLVISRNRH